MTQIRQFGPDKKQPFPFPGHKGLSTAMIQLPAAIKERLTDEQISERFDGIPILVNQDVAVAALYLEPQGELAEHDANQPTLVLVIGGTGFMRVGGPDAPVTPVRAGDAVLWPAFVLHKAWTEDEPMQLITVEYPAETPS